MRNLRHPNTEPHFVKLLTKLYFASLIVISFAFTIQANETIQIGYERGVLQGEQIELTITLESDSLTREMAGFDLLLNIDLGSIDILEIRPGQLYDDCAWEYFVSSIDTANGLIRIVGLADINDGNSPACLTGTTNELAVISVRVRLLAELECQFIPFRFYWNDCGDNTLTNIAGDTLFLSDRVYFPDYWEITADNPFPSHTGAPSSCDSVLAAGSYQRSVDFIGGGIDIRCQDIIDETGDINLNGISNEIADWVLFGNYFIYGLSVFSVNEFAQTLATDVNQDNIALSLDDLVFLTQIVTGDIIPTEENITTVSDDTVFFFQDMENKTVRFEYDSTISALYLIFEGEIVSIDSSTQSPGYHFDSTYTKVLYFPFENGLELSPFDSSYIFEYSGEGTLIGAMAAVDGALILNSNLPIPWKEIFACCSQRGNVDGLGELGSEIDIRDLLFLVNYIYGFPGNSVPDCLGAADVDGSFGSLVSININDLIYLVNYIFKYGPPPPDCP